MARKEKKQSTKPTENVLLGLAITMAFAAVVVFLVLFILTFIDQGEEEIIDPYENYYHLTQSELETIIKVNKSMTDVNGVIYYDSLESTNPELYEVLIDARVVYVLIYSSTNNYGREEDSKNKQIGDDLKPRVLSIDYRGIEVYVEGVDDALYGACFLIYDYKSSDVTALSGIYDLLLPTTSNDLYEISWATTPYTSQMSLLSPCLVEFVSSDVTGSKTQITVTHGHKGSIDYFANVLTALEDILYRPENE